MALTRSVCLLKDRAITSACCLHWLIQAFIAFELDCCCEISLLEVAGKAVQNAEYLMWTAKPGSISTVVHIVKKKMVLTYTLCYGLALRYRRVKIC